MASAAGGAVNLKYFKIPSEPVKTEMKVELFRVSCRPVCKKSMTKVLKLEGRTILIQ